jgi:hypothetical protein
MRKELAQISICASSAGEGLGGKLAINMKMDGILTLPVACLHIEAENELTITPFSMYKQGPMPYRTIS